MIDVHLNVERIKKLTYKIFKNVKEETHEVREKTKEEIREK
jgi:hypothetical protein